MKKLLTAAALAVAAALPTVIASPASAAPVEITVVDGFHYSADSDPLAHYVCLDGDLLLSVADASGISTASFEPGTYEISHHWDDSDDCTTTPSDSHEITILDVPSQTLFLHWPPFDESGTFAVVFEDTADCVAAGQGRVVFRNGAFYGEGGPASLVSGDTELVADVAFSAEGQADVDAGTYPDLGLAFEGGSIDFGDDLVVMEGVTTVIFGYGGADGAVGAMAFDYEVGTCAVEETTTTTTTVATTAPAPSTPTPTPAQPIRARANYAG